LPNTNWYTKAEKLLAICLDYPLQVDFYAYNNLLEGVENGTTTFNGLQELLVREDGATCLLNDLQKIKTDKISSYATAKELIGKMVVKQAILETLLSFDSMIQKMSKQQQDLLADLCMENLTTKVNMPEHFSSYSVQSSAYLLAKILQSTNGKKESDYSASYKKLLASGSIMDKNVIEELRRNYLNR